MATLQDFRDERLRKLSELKALGVNPYPSTAQRTHNLDTISKKFESLENKQVTVSGRIKSIRKFGKIAFVVIRDWTGELQLFMRANGNTSDPDRSASEFTMPNEINLLDTGDFVEASGTVIKTQTGEISVEVSSL